MLSFQFELYPLDEVSPWGGARPTLHWFGLTEGWYWIDANRYELLRRSRVVTTPYRVGGAGHNHHE